MKGAAKVAKVANDVRKGETASTEAATRDILHGAVDIATGMIPGGKLARKALGGRIDSAVDAGAGRIADGIAGAIPGMVEGIRGRAFREGHGGPAPMPQWDDPFASPAPSSPKPYPSSFSSTPSAAAAPSSSSSPSSTGHDWDPYWSPPPAATTATPDRGRGSVIARLREKRAEASSPTPPTRPLGTEDDPYRW